MSPVPQALYNLAIETSSRLGSVTLGRADEPLAHATMPPQVRHRVDLMPTIDGLCQQHRVQPADLGEIYVSIGPGSFTGLRIAIATARTLAQTTGAKLVAVPTLDVVAGNVGEQLAEVPGTGRPIEKSGTMTRWPNASALPRLAVGLNLKGQSLYMGVYDWAGQSGWRATCPPALMTLPALLAAHSGQGAGLAILGDPLPDLPDPLPPGMRILPASLAQPDSQQVWRLGRAAACRGEFTDMLALSPLYAREPEAVELWNKRHGAN